MRHLSNLRQIFARKKGDVWGVRFLKDSEYMMLPRIYHNMSMSIAVMISLLARTKGQLIAPVEPWMCLSWACIRSPQELSGMLWIEMSITPCLCDFTQLLEMQKVAYQEDEENVVAARSRNRTACGTCSFPKPNRSCMDPGGLAAQTHTHSVDKGGPAGSCIANVSNLYCEKRKRQNKYWTATTL